MNSEENILIPEDNKQIFCRVCFRHEDAFIYIFGSRLESFPVSITEMIKDFSSIEIIDTPNYPKYICETCIQELAVAYEFKQKLVTSNHYFPNSQPANIISESFKDDVTLVQQTEQSEIVYEKFNNEKEEYELMDLSNHTPLKNNLLNNELNDNSVSLVDATLTKVNESNVKNEDNISFETSQSIYKRFIVDENYFLVENDNEPTNEKLDSKQNVSDEYTTFETLFKKNINENLMNPIEVDDFNFEPIDPLEIQRTIETMKTESIDLEKSEFKCKLCECDFLSRDALILHLNNHETSPVMYKCNFCFVKFSNAMNLKRHMLSHYGQSTPFKSHKCHYCDKCYTTKVNRDLHEADHKEEMFKEIKNDRESLNVEVEKITDDNVDDKTASENQFTCEECKKVYNSKIQYKIHVRYGHDTANFQCGECLNKFAKETSLKCHISKVHGFKNLTEKKKNLRKKIIERRQDLRHLCDVCGKSFSFIFKLKFHMKTHENFTPYECSVCKKKFKFEVSFRKHCLLHEGVKNYICQYCCKAFSQNQHLKHHERTHTGERPFKCDKCEREFTAKDYLDIHKRWHNGEMPFACDVCPKKFYDKRALCKHKKRHILMNETVGYKMPPKNVDENVESKNYFEMNEHFGTDFIVYERKTEHNVLLKEQENVVFSVSKKCDEQINENSDSLDNLENQPYVGEEIEILDQGSGNGFLKENKKILNVIKKVEGFEENNEPIKSFKKSLNAEKNYENFFEKNQIIETFDLTDEVSQENIIVDKEDADKNGNENEKTKQMKKKLKDPLEPNKIWLRSRKKF